MTANKGSANKIPAICDISAAVDTRLGLPERENGSVHTHVGLHRGGSMEVRELRVLAACEACRRDRIHLFEIVRGSEIWVVCVWCGWAELLEDRLRSNRDGLD